MSKMQQELMLIEKLEKSDKWTRNNYSYLREKFPNEYVAINDGEVIDHYNNIQNLLKRLKNKHIDITTVLVEFIPEKGLEVLV